MSKPQPTPNDFEAQHQRAVEAYTRRVELLYSAAVTEAVRIAATLSVDESRVFRFQDYPAASARLQTLLSELTLGVQLTVVRGMDEAWALSKAKNDALVLEKIGVPAELFPALSARNEAARLALQNRVVGGLNLSQRVFNYTGQFRTELELSIDSALTSGQSAGALARSVKRYLREPDRLFRRVRNKRGQLVLSQQAKAFNPGQGVYRSSHKNAMRLSRTEINASYRTADFERWQGLPFVVGLRVQRSSNRVPCLLCDSMVGTYPKDFKWQMWHQQCRCSATPILATAEEVRGLTVKLLASADTSGFVSTNQVSRVNPGFTKWVRENQGRWENGTGSVPGFIQDNGRFVR